MKFLPENKKKTIWSIVLIVVFLSATFFVLSLGSKKGPTLPPPGTPEAGSAPATSPAAASSETAPQLSTSGPVLPYGSSLNLQILGSDQFKALRPAPALSVSPSELGKQDVFSQ